MKTIFVFFVLLTFFTFKSKAQSFTLVKDINVTGNSNPRQLVNLNGILYFVAEDGANGAELWKSNGISAGTSMVKDILSGSGGSDIQNLTSISGSALYFLAGDGSNGNEIWISDGTSAGTVLLKDINPTGSSFASGFVNMGGTVFFGAWNGVDGVELWKTDGTEINTVMVKDINPGPGSSLDITVIKKLVNVNGTLFFTADDGVNGMELWKSDGTSAGTIMVKDINTGVADSEPQYLIDVNNTLYFTANDGINGRELWKSDGTSAGTVMVKDINSGFGPSNPQGLAGIGSNLFFSADDGTNGRELWISNGTDPGTLMVKNINTISGSSDPEELINISGTLFFRAYNGVDGVELWKSNGTDAGTSMVKDINSGPNNSNPMNLSNVNNVLVFNANDGISGQELWRSFGNSVTTTMYQDIEPSGGCNPSVFVVAGSKGYMSANTVSTGVELWASETSTVLPLNILEFTGRLVNNDVQLTWKTTNEINLSSFEIERSIDSRNYIRLGSLPSTNTPGENAYSYTDAGLGTLNMPVVFYRLKQIDQDGKFTYSRIVQLSIDRKNRILLYPNPVINSINLAINSEKSGPLKCRVFDNTGRLVQEKRWMQSAGGSSYTIDASKLSSGIYVIEVTGPDFKRQFEIIKK